MGVKVRERGGGWWIFVDWKGRRRAKRCGSKKAAELAAIKIDAALKLGHVAVLDRDQPAAPVLTFAQYAEQWLTTVGAVRLRPSTVEQYQTRLRVRLLPTLGPVPITKITRETIRTLLGDMLRAGNRRSLGRSVARGTMQEALRTLSTILTTAEEDGVLPANPCRRMARQIGSTGAQEAQEVEVFDRSELERLLALAGRDWPEYGPFILCLARTGMRLGEAVALEWRDVDFESRVILVRRSRRRNRVSEPKNGKARRVDMSPHLTEALRTLQSIQEAEAAVAGTPSPARVFSNHRGGAIQDDHFRKRIWAPLLRRAELRYRKPHTLRHTFASLLIEAREDLPYIQHQLGHHSAAFTLRVYGHLMPRQGRRGVDALDDASIRNPRATAHPVASLS